MEVICDTNIWYGIGNGLIDISSIKTEDKLIATYNSIIEFSVTNNLLEIPEYTRNGIKSMFLYSAKHAIHEPPFVYLKKYYDSNFKYELPNGYLDKLKFLEYFAQGYPLDSSKNDEYKQKCVKDKDDGLNFVSEMFNKEARKIKEKIKDKKKHRKEDSIPLNRNMINSFVAYNTNTDGLPMNFDWKEIELFENVLKLFFNELETGARIAKKNDWFDLFLLVYVNPNRKIWTNEIKWKRLIYESKMEKYLYEK